MKEFVPQAGKEFDSVKLAPRLNERLKICQQHLDKSFKSTYKIIYHFWFGLGPSHIAFETSSPVLHVFSGCQFHPVAFNKKPFSR